MVFTWLYFTGEFLTKFNIENVNGLSKPYHVAYQMKAFDATKEKKAKENAFLLYRKKY